MGKSGYKQSWILRVSTPAVAQKGVIKTAANIHAITLKERIKDSRFTRDSIGKTFAKPDETEFQLCDKDVELIF